MLFNSAVFLVWFLPVVLLGFFLLSRLRRGSRLVRLWLTLASLVFYGWWNPVHVPLLVGSMGFNYLLGGVLVRRPSRAVLVGGVAANLLLLGYFKYTGFVVDALDGALGLGWTVPHIVLPLAVSFFTFQQIAYLSDAHDGAVVEHDFLNYCLFITFFPHLIAGPITHHKEMLSQFSDPDGFRPRLDNVTVGTTLFLLGLFKKVVVADPFSAFAGPVFTAAAAGQPLTFFEAWGGALSYALQIYFDFSGYTDMAIGLGLLFGISLPPNFDSPFKARNVIEFWSRWHMTLTRFLTAYVYNPLVLRITRARMAAGKPMPKRGRTTPGAFAMLVALPTVWTMFVSGVWHGAGWQYIVFGLLHGVFLSVNHGWRTLKARWGVAVDGGWLRRGAAVLGTFGCVVVGLVFFRAADVPAAGAVLRGMAGLDGAVLDALSAQVPGVAGLAARLGIAVREDILFTRREGILIVAMLLAAWTLPNTQQWMRHYRTALSARVRPDWVSERLPRLSWRPAPGFAVVIGLMGFLALLRAFSVAPTEFLYFQF